MFKFSLKSAAYIFLVLFSTHSYAQQCLQGRVSILTEDGIKSSRAGVPITIKNNRTKAVLGTDNTDRFGLFCISIDHMKAPAGLEVYYEMGDPKSENNQKWSSWVVFSPFQGVSYFPSSEYKPIEILITPEYMYSTFFEVKNSSLKSEKEKCSVNSLTSFVQVASLRSDEDARMIENSLKTEYKTCILPVKVRKEKYFRVLVFPGKNSTAKKTCKQIKETYKYRCFSRAR